MEAALETAGPQQVEFFQSAIPLDIAELLGETFSPRPNVRLERVASFCPRRVLQVGQLQQAAATADYSLDAPASAPWCCYADINSVLSWSDGHYECVHVSKAGGVQFIREFEAVPRCMLQIAPASPQQKKASRKKSSETHQNGPVVTTIVCPPFWVFLLSQSLALELVWDAKAETLLTALRHLKSGCRFEAGSGVFSAASDTRFAGTAGGASAKVKKLLTFPFEGTDDSRTTGPSGGLHSLLGAEGAAAVGDVSGNIQLPQCPDNVLITVVEKGCSSSSSSPSGASVVLLLQLILGKQVYEQELEVTPSMTNGGLAMTSADAVMMASAPNSRIFSGQSQPGNFEDEKFSFVDQQQQQQQSPPLSYNAGSCETVFKAVNPSFSMEDLHRAISALGQGSAPTAKTVSQADRQQLELLIVAALDLGLLYPNEELVTRLCDFGCYDSCRYIVSSYLAPEGCVAKLLALEPRIFLHTVVSRGCVSRQAFVAALRLHLNGDAVVEILAQIADWLDIRASLPPCIIDASCPELPKQSSIGNFLSLLIDAKFSGFDVDAAGSVTPLLEAISCEVALSLGSKRQLEKIRSLLCGILQIAVPAEEIRIVGNQDGALIQTIDIVV